MERIGYIEIKVTGKKGSIDLSPDNYDIRDLIPLLQQAENLLFPTSKKERPTISYDVQEGSVRHIIKTSLQVIIGFNAILAQIEQENFSIDFLDTPTAKAFEFFVETAKKQGLSFDISTSVKNSNRIRVDTSTVFSRTEEVWVDTEFYFYGVITDMGGKNEANIHLDTKEFNVLKIDAKKDLLASYKGNPLYKRYGLRASGKQNAISGEIDKASLQLIEIIDYDPSFNENYIQGLIKKARKSWEGVGDADEWLAEMR